MKKLTVAVLLLLVCCMSAFAEADAHEDMFTFRNGVQWSRRLWMRMLS